MLRACAECGQTTATARDLDHRPIIIDSDPALDGDLVLLYGGIADDPTAARGEPPDHRPRYRVHRAGCGARQVRELPLAAGCCPRETLVWYRPEPGQYVTAWPSDPDLAAALAAGTADLRCRACNRPAGQEG